MNRLFLDSWAWIEFFKGSQRGSMVREQISSGCELFTVSTNLFETLYRISEDEGAEPAQKALSLIENRSKVVPIDKSLGVMAVDVRLKEKLHALDAFALAAARLYHAKLLTGDPHFKGKKDVLFLE